MDPDRLDPEGYIRPEADLANVQPEYQGVPEAAAGLLAGEFRGRLHSAYLYGSVVRGNAVPGRSDVDLIAVLPAAPVDEDRARADRVEQALVERFPVPTTGQRAWTGTEDGWLGGEAPMWWSHADAATYRAWIEQAGLAVVAQELVPEGDGAHALFWARRPPDPPPGEPTSSPPRARPGCAGRHGQDGAMNGTADAGE